MKNKNYIILLLIIIFFILLIIIYLFVKYPIRKINLPIFNSKKEFDNSNWKKYYDIIYGENTIKDSDFPINTGNLWVLYKDILKNTLNIDINPNDYKYICPDEENQLYSNMSGAHDIDNTIWLYKNPPYNPLPSNKFVEVTHCTDPEVESNENVGAWFYYAPGSGIYFNLGNTIYFDDHSQSVKHFLNQDCLDSECVDYFPDLFNKAKSLGYDSIQYLKHSDMRCGNTAIEIVDVKAIGKYTCVIENIDDNWNLRYRSGYNGVNKCNCDNKKICMNC
jgi:hypothetical protein